MASPRRRRFVVRLASRSTLITSTSPRLTPWPKALSSGVEKVNHHGPPAGASSDTPASTSVWTTSTSPPRMAISSGVFANAPPSSSDAPASMSALITSTFLRRTALPRGVEETFPPGGSASSDAPASSSTLTTSTFAYP
eukprot:scaffold44091_cov52-Phaeocystis_antarctica.AAC.3